MTFREFKLLITNFWFCIKSRNYRYSTLQDNSIGFYLRQYDPQLHKEIFNKLIEQYEKDGIL